MSIKSDDRKVFKEGLRDGCPIAFGYIAVSFSLGILAKSAGFSPIQGFITSILGHASAGEYAFFTSAAENATLIMMSLAVLVANARYFLMSAALSQRMRPDEKGIHRVLVGFALTDEIFGINIAKKGFLNPYYTYGAMSIAFPFWAGGTALGIAVGNILPDRAVSALSVALYAMFLAIIIPPSRKSKAIAVVIVVSFALSWAFSVIPLTAGLSAGTRTMILTVAIAAIASIIRPVKEDPYGE